MAELITFRAGKAGRITLTRPQALNALSYEMCREVARALDEWRDDPEIALVVIDATGDRAFCAGGDIQEMYETGRQGDFDYGRRFWADEYRMNAAIAEYPKPVVTLLHGYTMGGGVGLGCHASHRIVCETSQIAMPEVAIGLVPDVGGTHLLARAPGRIGEYLASTAARMGPGDAIHAGFADLYVPREFWLDLTLRLESTGDLSILDAMAEAPPPGPVAAAQGEIDHLFAGSPGEIATALAADGSDFAQAAFAALRRASPLAVACGLANIRARRTDGGGIRPALRAEYRFTFRASEKSDFLEGIRAAIIDKDKAPRWQHAGLDEVTGAEVAAMLADLGPDELRF
ncbi:enoyl-CoA hydratase/isomerase family protein [Sinisalibacter aestuarii]|uniref:3-hydroxyisobutyryl-CoA hydrolase n=1 Tax=Sinisalibacter aestuarii TaxID=2949426 RepID=A0ABQ5LXB0_9RHOB|nr:enoyl-CoA hydratase/isomerase family protein [Sinisalibacter aestuarii]GKY89016.1 enoyl-CoA hydratase [Sinisalibacter aestuarii]